jgi:hypothetical protein
VSASSYDELAVVHVGCRDARARRELIVRHMPRLGAEATAGTPARTWYFVDIPAQISTDMLEVALLHGRSDPVVNRDLDRWLRDADASGLIVSSRRVSESLVLNPQLFLGGRVPAYFLVATARHSARAATLLRDPVVDVRAEIDAIFAELIAEDDRGRALDLYAAWLEHVATGQASRPTGTPPAWALRASYVARLAHTQVVRLQGPESGGGLLHEAALVRTLLSS